ncbi:peroxidase family protein [Archangium lansingense]|uniref:peroxidase family protein n=1 Tax=Archangium lansingense TaxID=2995310 RepID=UPI003B7BE231
MQTRTNTPVLDRFTSYALERISRRYPWYKQRKTLAVLTLVALRRRLRAKNLYSTSMLAPPEPMAAPSDGSVSVLGRRPDGMRTDLKDPLMGAKDRRFGRNIELDKVIPESGSVLMTPNPREVSRILLARDTFKPAVTLNLLAAAWIQFQVHDWFEHALDADSKNDHAIPIEKHDTWHQKSMRVPRTLPISPGIAGKDPPSYVNKRTHWWDASQIYGDDPLVSDSLRSRVDGKLVIGPDRLLPVDGNGIERTGMTQNWWLGLSLLHNLFTLEHNAICDRLKQAHPDLTDEELYRHAQHVNCALIAKIHTVEWTTAILGHPVLKIAMNANWTGIANQKVSRLLKLTRDKEVLNGIPRSPTDHYGVDYAMTEEFAAVYRMHPLIPDQVPLRSLADPRFLRLKPIRELAGSGARKVQRESSMEDLFYSFGMTHPGAITLHNYPDFLRDHEPVGAQSVLPPRIDLATIDILRDRERGVPRYNDFRAALRMPRLKSFDQLTTNKTWQRELHGVYGDINRVDLMVGLYAEAPPPGFGFSDTAFRIFILMASRRLKSDRFFTTEYNEQNYTRAGLDWVDQNTMGTVLARHYPELAPVLAKVDNAFAPWVRVGAAGR